MVAHPVERQAAMERAGFSGGVDVQLESVGDSAGVIMMQFRDPASALDAYRVHLQDSCRLAIDSAPLPGIPGVAYMRYDGLAKALFVVGNTEVALDICRCASSWDRLQVVADWAVAVNQQLSTPAT
jgi:hypothetical protein